MEMGQVPGVVRVPTFHVQEIAPVEDAVLPYSPWAVDGPLR